MRVDVWWIFPVERALSAGIPPIIAHLPTHLVLVLWDTLGNDSAGTVVALFHVLLEGLKRSARSCWLKLRGTLLGQGDEGAVPLAAS